MPAVRQAKYNLPQDDIVYLRVEPLRFSDTAIHIEDQQQDVSRESPENATFTIDPLETYQESPFTRLFAGIGNLSQLKDNWNSYGAAAPNKTALFWARRVLEVLLRTNFAPEAVTASSDEGVAIYFRSDTRRASIECLNSGEIWAVFAEDTDAPKVWPVPQTHLNREIGTIKTLFTQ